MKLKQFSDEVMQQQLHDYADKVRKATAADLSICMIQSAPDDDASSLATACGISARHTSRGSATGATRDAAFAMLLTASQIINKLTGGQVTVLIRSPNGDHPIEPGKLNKWLVEDGGK